MFHKKSEKQYECNLMGRKNKQIKYVFWWVVFLSIILVFFFIRIGVVAMREFGFERILHSTFVAGQVEKYAGVKEGELFALAPQLLGYDEQKIYLVLFQNNTELRPSGGFLGAYGILRLTAGHAEILKLEGTEIIDNQTPDDWKPEPPTPLSTYLGVDRWYFRDANWSPDFSLSAMKALELYRGEGGEYAEEIDAVFAFTPTVLEEVLKIIGPVTIQNLTFESASVTETLEYEVEYGYEARGISFENRKQILAPFMESLIAKIQDGGISVYGDMLNLGTLMIKEKQIVAYALDRSVQDQFDSFLLSGAMTQTTGDYMLWVDANMAALKTDHAIERALSYQIDRDKKNLMATATMTYKHNGNFDWRTSRYRSYVRVFVPFGAEVISARIEGGSKGDKDVPANTIDIGVENGRQWFGTFVSIEPGTRGSLSFSYTLPPFIVEQVNTGEYMLTVQKQLGTIDPQLTLDLEFGTTLQSATPAENPDQWGDDRYVVETDLRIDRIFKVDFGNE
jgi:hypothetical protein